MTRNEVLDLKKTAFVSWRFIEDVLVPSIKDMKHPNGGHLFKLDSTHEYYETGTQYNKRSNKIKNDKYIRSLNQNICFIPGQHYAENVMPETTNTVIKVGEATERYATQLQNDFIKYTSLANLPYPSRNVKYGSRSVTDQYANRGSQPFKSIDAGENTNVTDFYYLDLFNADSNFDEGYVRNIMVNVDFIIETYNSTDSIKDFIKALLENINKACGSPWEIHLLRTPWELLMPTGLKKVRLVLYLNPTPTNQ